MTILPKLIFVSVISAVTTLHTKNTFSQELPKAIKSYEEAWKEANFQNRLNILKSFWTEESVYEDPGNQVRGVEALKAVIDKFWQDFPGATLEMGIVLSQGNFHTWTWSIFDRNKNLMLKGVDVAVTNDKGQMTHLAGFWYPQK